MLCYFGGFQCHVGANFNFQWHCLIYLLRMLSNTLWTVTVHIVYTKRWYTNVWYSTSHHWPARENSFTTQRLHCWLFNLLYMLWNSMIWSLVTSVSSHSFCVVWKLENVCFCKYQIVLRLKIVLAVSCY